MNDNFLSLSWHLKFVPFMAVYCNMINKYGQLPLQNDGRPSHDPQKDGVTRGQLELMLCYQECLKLVEYWEQQDTSVLYNAQKAIEILLRPIIKFVPRTTGNK